MSEQKVSLDQQSESVPWTLQQTFVGILLTLVPWVALALGLSASSTPTSLSAPLTPSIDLTNAAVNFVFSTLIEAAFLIAPFYFASRAYRDYPRPQPRRKLLLNALGFRRFPIANTLFFIILFFLAIYAVNGIYQYLITALHLSLQTNDQFILQRSKDAPFSTYATLIASVLVAPLCEELFFRSFVFMGLLRAMPLAGAILLSALIFAVAHADIGSFAVLFIIGIALAFLRWRTRSVWPGILLHLLNNGVGAVLIVLTMQGIIK